MTSRGWPTNVDNTPDAKPAVASISSGDDDDEDDDAGRDDDGGA